MSMDFTFELAEEKDIEALTAIMEEAAREKEHPEWFLADTGEYIREHLRGKGFVAAARSASGELAGFFIIKTEESELCDLMGFDEEQRSQTAIMDSAVVRRKYRGNGLQGRMLAYCESRMAGYRYFLCTVHPDNYFSLANMQKGGFRIAKRVTCYGGLDRLLLLKTMEDK